MRAILSGLLILAVFSPTTSGDTWTLGMDVHGQRREGTPLRWTNNQVHMLFRDGSTEILDRRRVKNVQKLTRGFRSHSAATMRDALRTEFGSYFDVSATQHYLVVHRAGDSQPWAERFEALYRDLIQYFSVRNIDVHEPKFPLVAVIMPNEASFQKYARSQGINLGPGYLGFYVSDSNRILMFETDQTTNFETVIHEAAHQTSFNTGIHNRFSPPPRWVCEGIGTLFEAPGVYNSSTYKGQRDRINRGQLAAYRHYFPNGADEETLLRLISEDRFFQSNTNQAYSLSWALTFMFAEQESGALSSYLKRTAAGKSHSSASRQTLLRDFATAFGSDLPMLAARLHRFMTDLP